MLVLGRGEGREIRIGDDIYVRVVRIDSDYVRLGIRAPREVNVVRTDAIARATGED